MTGNKNVSKIASVLLALIMVFGLLISPIMQLGETAVYADTHQVATWDQLVNKIRDAVPGDVIEITGDINAEGTITIDKEITIQGDGTQRFIYQKERTSYDTLFKVVGPDGNLTLGEKLVLSGKTVSCSAGTAQAVEKTEANTHTLSEYAVTEPGGNAKAKFTSASGNWARREGTNQIQVTSTYSATEFEIDDNGLFILENMYVTSPTGNGTFTLNNNSDNGLYLADVNKNSISPADINADTDYYIVDNKDTYRGFVWNDGGTIRSNGTSANALPFRASGITAGTAGGSYWDIPTNTPITDPSNITRFKNPDEQTAAEAALENLNNTLDPKKFKHVPGADLTVITNKYYYYPEQDKWVNSGGKTIGEAMEAYNAAHQSCDGADCPKTASDPTYTKTTFDDGTITQPHGFFVQVQGGGKATLDGATLEHFITSRDKGTTPRYVAPVTVWGTDSTFDVKGGEIKNNIVGYIVDDSMANKSADVIKYYIKGAAPNAARKGTYATKQYRRNRKAGIDGDDAGSGITATAGAIIYADGGQGEISAGSIGFNRGDTGGIMATGEGTVVTLKEDADINSNVGVQFGGGVTTEDGAAIKMSNGRIRNNVAWFGGGGVYATENGVRWLLGEQTLDQRKDGIFQMFDGTIEGNTAFTRGGGFFVDSDGVSLLKGVIKDNLSHMLGGGMYVMGDDANFTYTVYINKGYVHDNKAVSAGPKTSPYTDADNQKLSKLLAAPNGCATTTDLFDGYMSVNSDDINDGYPNPPSDASDGTGGGVWLCAYGNTVLNVADDSFIIDKNYATGSFRHGKAAQDNKVPEGTSSEKAGGNDFHKETKGSGNIVLFGITDNSVKWYDENTGEQYTSLANAKSGAVTDYSLRNLTYSGEKLPSGYDPNNTASYEGINVFGNMSRRGGGLAADGTFFFGDFRALGEAYSELAVTKTWEGGTQPEDVTIRISLEYKDGEETKVLPVIELPLSEDPVQGSELDTVFTDGSETVGGKMVYKGHIVLPITVEDEDGNQIQLFDLVSDVDGRIFSLDTADGLYELGQYLKNGGPGGTPGTVSLSTMNRRLVYEELVDDGSGNLVKAAGFEITPSSMRLSTDPPPEIHETEIRQLQTDGSNPVVGSMITSDIRFEADLYNDKPSEIDKYVNKAVHKDIDLDEVFEYDVIAYVKHGTDKIIIEDKLVEDLEFVSTPAEVKVVSLDENNHFPQNNVNGAEVNSTASVAKLGETITNKTVEISDDNKLTVIIENKLEEVKDVNGETIGYKNATTDQNLKELWGKWVRVTYKAQIKEELQKKIKAGEMTVKDLENVTVYGDEKYKADPSIFDDDPDVDERPEPNVGNQPVKTDEDHKGIPNTASYTLEVKNEPEFRDESNTVTVKPEQTELEKYVNKAVHKDIELDEVFTYDIIGYITRDADKVIIEDQLVDDLEFADAEVEVVYLDENNHKPQNNISGEEVNSDASVAEAGTPVPEEGLTIEKSADGKLTVTIDDNVRVDPNTGGITRERDTVKNLRQKYVKVTFKAQIKKSIQEEIANGTKTIEDLSNVKVKGTENKPVRSDEAHDGIVNEASIKIEVGNKGKYSLTSNKVTVKPEQPELFDIPVTKVWNEYMSDSSKRPTSITIKLLANGEDTGRSLTLTEGVSWKGIFKNLPKCDADGKEIDYTIEEGEVEFYYADILWTDFSYKVTNHTRPWIPRLPSTPGNVGHVNVTKTVSGAAEENKDYEIEVKFTYKDGSTYEHTLVLNPKKNASFLFDYIPVGTKVEVKEKTTGYNATFKTDGKESSNVVVEIGKTHEVVINNDKPGTPTKTGDNNRIVELLVLITLLVLSVFAVACRKRIATENER